MPRDLDGLDALVLPGGESTTIGKLAVRCGLLEPLREFARNHVVWGSCAGAILLSKDAHCDQPLIGAMDISVDRNAFGSQIDSFMASLTLPVGILDDQKQQSSPFPAIFIRAPVLHVPANAANVKVLARLPDGRVVAALQGRLLATSFHPELTNPADTRFHEFFLRMAATQVEK